MQHKYTLTEIERVFALESGKKMPVVYPKVQTLNFIKQFAYAYHTEKELPLPLAAIILN
ncbi:MAG: hypothetical protein FWF53_05520 [Candidatus Azobacteroides sp.]|nr:hypothetical protein [Candidatus Azobacteroides sp.]